MEVVQGLSPRESQTLHDKRLCFRGLQVVDPLIVLEEQHIVGVGVGIRVRGEEWERVALP